MSFLVFLFWREKQNSSKFLGRQFNLDIASVVFFFLVTALSFRTRICFRLTGFCVLFRNPFVFVIESFVLALIPSVRCDPILVLNPIIVFTAPDLEMILENKTSAWPRSLMSYSPLPVVNSLHEFFSRVDWLIVLDSVNFPSEFSRKKGGVDRGLNVC